MAKKYSLYNGNSASKERLLVTAMLLAVTLVMVSACSSAPDPSRAKPKKSAPNPSATTLVYDPVPAQAKALVEKMSLEDKVAQMFMVTLEAFLQRNQWVVAAGEPAQQAFDRRPVGALFITALICNPRSK